MTRLLYVEDDPDVRAFVETLLAGEGYDVSAVGSAEDGAAALARDSFDMVLTDYNLPGRNADWMLSVARHQGLLENTPIVVLTATPEPSGVDGAQVLRKPVDVDVLLDVLSTVQSPPVGASCDPELDETAAIELRLYVTPHSRESQKAIRHLRRLLRHVAETRVRLRICDVTDRDAPVSALEEDRVVVTPTLVRAWPLPKVWIIGDLSRTDAVADLIASALRPESGPN